MRLWGELVGIWTTLDYRADTDVVLNHNWRDVSGDFESLETAIEVVQEIARAGGVDVRFGEFRGSRRRAGRVMEED